MRTKINNLTNEQLISLCDAIRTDILNHVSENGGYLSDNLSVVEISVALNKVFDHDDKIFYVSRKLQYPQAIIDGKDLSSLDERYNDFSSAFGYALTDIDKNVVAVIDGQDFSYGDNIEILNQFNNINNKLINNARNARTYNNLKNIVKSSIRPIRNGQKIIDNIHKIKDTLKKNIVDEGIFENYNIDYIGPIDGHNINELIKAFSLARHKNGAVVVHCLTKKGKGYKYALNDRQYEYITPFDIDNGKIYGQEDDNNRYCMNIIADTLLSINNKDLVVLSNDIYQDGFSSLFARIPDQSFMMKLSDINKLRIASGVSLNNRYPLITLKSDSLNNPDVENILNNLNKPLLITVNVSRTDNHDFISKLYNTDIYIPKDAISLKNIINSYFASNKPLIILLCEKCMQINEENLGIEQFSGNNNMKDILIVSYGKDINTLNRLIKDNNLDYDLYDYSLINHIDRELSKMVKRYKNVYFYGDYFDYLKNEIKAQYFKKEGINKLFEHIERDLNA